jgi:hypothetical protein
LSGGPTRAAQAALLERLRPTLEPILRAERVPTDYVLQPGTRLRRAYGRCVWFPETQHAVISVRCTADDDRLRWRHTGAIVGTLLHEAAHLRYRSHGPRFWTLHRRLVDRAVAAGVYDPTDRDPAERGRGDEKLAASAARSVALAARAARLERMRANRLALQAWQAGATARIVPSVGGLAGAMVRVVGLGRSRLLIETSDRRRYRIAPSLLIPA